MLANTTAVVSICLALGIGQLPPEAGVPIDLIALDAMAKDVVAEKRGTKNPFEIGWALDKRVASRWGYFLTGHPALVESNDLTVDYLPPYLRYRTALVERVRRMESIDDLPWGEAVIVRVNPKTIHAPDIVKVVLQRAGVEVQSTTNTLGPMEMKNAMGATFTKNAGVIAYPLEAFAPGATVKFIIIPDSGTNIEVDITERLGMIR